MKRLIIIKSGCKEFGNELLNHMSIYAYGLEIGAPVINHSVYGYPFALLRVFHAIYARYIGHRHARCSLRAWRAPIFLPPTKPLLIEQNCNTPYFFGWVFRNPVGIEKYRKEIIATFVPSKRVQENISHIISSFPTRRTLIGIHIRQKPFPGFSRDDFLVSVERVKQIVDEYVREKNLDAKKDVALMIVSDMPIPEEVFVEYTYRVEQGNKEDTLFLLSRCSTIIGTNTTFSNMAAWFGNIPHIVTTDEPVEWGYYRNRLVYFENKYATFAY